MTREDERGQAGTAMSRRALLGAAAAGTAGLVLGGLAGRGTVVDEPPTTGVGHPASFAARVHPFHGPHQAGVTTRVQNHIVFAAFDMLDGTRERDLVRVLQDWSAAAARMTQGLPIGPGGAHRGDADWPPDDTGEAIDLPASALTVTFGFGPSLFERGGVDRYRLAARRPPDLQRLPPFVRDDLSPVWSDGDLAVQACADDPQVAVHAVRNLVRIAAGRATVRWSQAGFGGASRTTAGRPTPRNLLGFKDGTANILGDDEVALAEHVWLPAASDPPWLAGGTTLVVRRIALLVDDWDDQPLAVQEAVIGRTKGTGAPLSGGDESTAPDFAAQVHGAPAIDPAAHIRLAHASNADGIRILRRSYNFVASADARGRLDAGLLFISFQRSPARFITILRALATDRLNDYLRTTGSAVFAVPPGTSEGGFIGEGLVG